MRILLCTLVVSVVGLLAGGAQAELINYYGFEGGLGDSAGLYFEAGGHDSATTLTANAGGKAPEFTAGPAGRAGTAMHMFNTSYDADLIPGTQIDFPADDPDIALGANFTIEFWAYSDNYANTTTQDFVTASNYGLRLTNNHNWNPGNISVSVGTSGTSVAPRYTAGTWLHMAMVVDSSTGVFTHYINPGAQDGSERIIAGLFDVGTLGTTTTLRLGSTYTFMAPLFYSQSTDAYLDDLAMWNTALDYGTLSAHTAAGNPMLTPEPATLAMLGVAALAVRRRRTRSGVICSRSCRS